MLKGFAGVVGNLAESFRGGSLTKAKKWNPFRQLETLSVANENGPDAGISFFRRQSFGQRLSTLFFTLAGEPNQAGVLDYLLFTPAALRFMCAAAAKVDKGNVFSAAVAGLLLTPRLALYALVNLLAALLVLALFVPMLFLHGAVGIYNLHSERKAENHSFEGNPDQRTKGSQLGHAALLAGAANSNEHLARISVHHVPLVRSYHARNSGAPAQVGAAAAGSRSSH